MKTNIKNVQHFNKYLFENCTNNKYFLNVNIHLFLAQKFNGTFLWNKYLFTVNV